MRFSRFVNNNKAFTLVELLVVVSIISILLAILIPSLQKVRSTARSIICRSNLRQWGDIFTMYLDDNDGYFNTGWLGMTESPTPPGSGVWINILRPYYEGNEKIRCCPVANKPVVPEGIKIITGTAFKAYGVFNGTDWTQKGDYASYGMNNWVCDSPPKYTNVKGRDTRNNFRTPNRTKQPDEVPVFLDSIWIDGSPMQTDDPPELEGQIVLSGFDDSMNRFCINRHSENVNCLFMDCSVRKVGIKELWTLKWHCNFDTAGPWTLAGGVTKDKWPKWMRKFKDY